MTEKSDPVEVMALRDALDRIARFGEAFVAARDACPSKKHSHAGDAMVATLANYARSTLQQVQ